MSLSFTKNKRILGRLVNVVELDWGLITGYDCGGGKEVAVHCLIFTPLKSLYVNM